MAEEIINVVLLAFLAATAIAVTRLRNLFAVIMLTGIYSLLSATIFVVLDAVDVAFTEAAVGAGITTVLMLGTLVLTDRDEKRPKRAPLAPLLLVVITGAVLIYATFDMRQPRFGDPNAVTNKHVVPEYLKYKVRQVGKSKPTKVHIPNVVTTTLASYRGYDTFGEVVVIFTAGIGVLLMLGVARREPDASEGDDGPSTNNAGGDTA